MSNLMPTNTDNPNLFITGDVPMNPMSNPNLNIELGEILEPIFSHWSENTGSDISEGAAEIKTAIEAYCQRQCDERERDVISDMIIECYNHDNPMEIAKELEEERRRIEKSLGGQ